jgi:hypothetical protein
MRTMPKGDPGSLAPGEYAAIVAYSLKINGMPAGGDTLPSDSAALRKIRIDTTAVPGRDAGTTSPVRRRIR